MPQKILVTGGAGFIGRNTAAALATSHDVLILDDLSSGNMDALSGFDCEFVKGSVTDDSLLADLLTDCSAVIHLAARGSVPRSLKDPLATHEVNATGTLRVLEAARQAEVPLIFSSSSSVYGSNPALPKRENDWTRPISPYGASKLAAESYVLAYASAFQHPTLALRFFNVFGPWQRPDHVYAAVVPKWLWKAMNGEVLHVNGDGSQTRDFTYVDSVVEILESAVKDRVSRDTPINLAFGERRSLLELLEEIEKVIGQTLRVEFGPPREGDVHQSQNDPALLKEAFPEVSPVPFDDALVRTAEWLDVHAGSFSSPGHAR